MKSFASRIALLGALAVAGAALAEPLTVRVAPSGPAADYPMVIGDPFTIEGTTYKPGDTLNYDAVGYVAIDAGGGQAITGSHKTLPLPSYVEVTSLESGRTILVRLERRGPMTNSRLIALSPGALAQLGMAGGNGAVRVRRVNPPEPERSVLRGGGAAPLRMDTPKPLLAVLMRKLDQQNGGAPVVLTPQPATMPGAVPSAAPSSAPGRLGRPLVPHATLEPQAAPRATPSPEKWHGPAIVPAPVATIAPRPTPAATGSLVVQVAALSNKARADALAAQLGGRVTQAGRVWRIRMGPFATHAEAAAALAKARGAGYSDARIQRAD